MRQLKGESSLEMQKKIEVNAPKEAAIEEKVKEVSNDLLLLSSALTL
jgi:hypothetical protein